MPIPAKPCEGRFSDEVLVLLSKNQDRAQWANHKCEVCGASVGAVLDKGKWVPEQHWPSVKYPRQTAEKKQSVPPKSITPDDSIVFAGSGSR